MTTRGFTMLELVLMLLISALLALVVTPRLMNLPDLEGRLERSDALAALRYTRALALGGGCETQLVVDNGGYRVERRQDCTSGSFVATLHPAYLSCNPADCPPCLSSSDYAGCPAGLSASRAVFRFDTLGRALDEHGTPLDGSITSRGLTLRVVGETGFAYAP